MGLGRLLFWERGSSGTHPQSEKLQVSPGLESRRPSSWPGLHSVERSPAGRMDSRCLLALPPSAICPQVVGTQPCRNREAERGSTEPTKPSITRHLHWLQPSLPSGGNDFQFLCSLAMPSRPMVNWKGRLMVDVSAFREAGRDQRGS